MHTDYNDPLLIFLNNRICPCITERIDTYDTQMSQVNALNNHI